MCLTVRLPTLLKLNISETIAIKCLIQASFGWGKGGCGFRGALNTNFGFFIFAGNEDTLKKSLHNLDYIEIRFCDIKK